MIKIENRIQAFSRLSERIREILDSDKEHNLNLLVKEGHIYNPWFTEENVRYAFSSICKSLEEDKIRKWLDPYISEFKNKTESKTVGVVMAGNLPLVGFHDFLSVLISGHRILVKLSSDDDKLLPAIIDLLLEIEPAFDDYIQFTENKLADFDAIIATGSNNSSRYFDYYFGKYPHIIRKNRNGVAVLTGDENQGELEALGRDVFAYFGLGCRSISKFFVPESYKFDPFFEAIESYADRLEHHKYKNNYDYYRSIYLVNQIPHFDNGFLMITEEAGYSSPPSVIYYEKYSDLKDVKNKLKIEQDQIQCVVGGSGISDEVIPFGNAQKPDLWDYADGVDTMKFLLGLK